MAQLKRNEIMNIVSGLAQIARMPHIIGNAKFTYAMAKNRRNLIKEAEKIQEDTKIQLANYGEEMEEIAKKFELKGKDGKPQLNQMGQSSLDPVFKLDFDKAKKEIEEKYKEDIDTNKSYMEEKVDVDIHKIENANFPDMPVGVADLIFPLRRE